LARVEGAGETRPRLVVVEADETLIDVDEDVEDETDVQVEAVEAAVGGGMRWEEACGLPFGSRLAPLGQDALMRSAAEGARATADGVLEGWASGRALPRRSRP